MENFLAQYGVWIGLVILIIEYILGKTTVVKANSIVEAILNVVVKVFKAIIGEK